MRIEFKQNQIVIEFSEKESNFIAQTSGLDKAEDISNYIKSKVIKALVLEKLESTAMSSVGGDFNLDKIKNVSDELKKRQKTQDTISIKEVRTTTISRNIDPINNEASLNIEVEDTEDIIDVDVDPETEDEILAELLDKNLLKSRRKSPKSGKKAD